MRSWSPDVGYLVSIIPYINYYQVIVWFLVKFGKNMHEWVFQKRTNCTRPSDSCNFVHFWKTHSCMFFPNCTRNHTITYTKITSYQRHRNSGIICLFIAMCNCLSSQLTKSNAALVKTFHTGFIHEGAFRRQKYSTRVLMNRHFLHKSTHKSGLFHLHQVRLPSTTMLQVAN